MVKRNVYLSILAVGSIFALLSYVTNESREIALTILYITLFVLATIKLIEEWRYYQSYNAPLASVIFLLIPSITGIGGTILASSATLGFTNLLQTPLMNVTISLDIIGGGSLYVFLNIFSLIFCLTSYIVVLILIQRYYSGRYPSIFVFRKRLPNELVILYNGILLLLFTIIWVENRTIELVTISFLLFSIAIFIQHYVLKIVVVPFRRVRSTPQRRRVYSDGTPVISWGDTRPPNQTRVSRPTQTQPISPSRTRSSSSSRARSASTPRVVPALSTSQTRTVSKLSPAIINSLTPLGQHLTEDDFRCIFCYEFPVENHRQVVICPHCKHPSHENEFNKWIAVANICSRCNKPVKNVKMIRLPGSSYHKVIKMFRNKS